MEQTAETFSLTSNAWSAWNNLPDGKRERLWCKLCRDEGNPWLTPEPCEHVLEAEPETEIPVDVAMNTLRKLMSEEPTQAPSA
jgi:hypothetical protein